MDRNEKRGEMQRHRSDEAASADADDAAKPNRDTRDDGRGRDAGRSGSDSSKS